MSFRCTACPDKSYDKAWKLQRHIRESIKCFEQLNPGTSATRFRCSICDYTSPREEDLRRHHRRIHSDIAIATATDTEQPMLGSYETSDVASCPQPVMPLDSDGCSNEIEPLDPHHSPKSPTAVIKRKTSGPDYLSPDHHKRICFESALPDLDALSSADDSDAREVSTFKTTDNEGRPLLRTRQPTAGEITALVVSTCSAKLQNNSSSSMGAPQSISTCGSSVGSLFGLPSTHVYEPWRTWSHTSLPPDSVRSLHSVGMPAPMLDSVDEELLLSRAGNDLSEPRYRHHRATDFGVNSKANYYHRAVRCIFDFEGCPDYFIRLELWIEHYFESHFQDVSPPPRLRCAYSPCNWACSTQDVEDAGEQQWKHLNQEHADQRRLSRELMRRCLGMCGPSKPRSWYNT
jgi:hypothetical protein